MFIIVLSILSILSIIFIFIFVIFKYFKVIQKYENNIPIYVISLKKTKERRKKIHDMLNGQVKFSFYNGIDGKDMTKKDIELSDKIFKKDSLTKNQRGCFLSHLSLYEKIKKENIPNTLILEDDAKIDKFYYIKNLDKFIIDDYDIIFLGHCAENKGKFVKELFELRKSVSPRCTHAYLISQKGVNKLLEYFYSKKWGLPIDELIYKCDLNKYSLFPILIRQNGIK